MNNERYAPYARETAICVDFAYSSFEDDLKREIEHAQGEVRQVLVQLLARVAERRAALDQFTQISQVR